MFSISIQKYGPLLRTTDERSSADFHSGRTSDGNRCKAIPAKERIAAETRYAHALKKQLGGPEQVAAALDTMHRLEESPPEVMSPDDLTLLKA
ncbi:hypothetical protein J2W88_003461 [Acidovorax delafieldii]|uniref:Uncharacterized protein n=1 Tax=Acidovorax delafieldii TaxID=47920 RepID=A0AAJ2BZ22_ACIDE|nr:hypothetical protein [Acidovorax delafieldii]MDR6768159.1 hypothetical protein [Acidovorax delafieldii]MDR6837811.1 hypothetical protein [Acidovorax delafieldii]MDR7367301.1 hypothetical protein [Acidovorax delafieldii]